MSIRAAVLGSPISHSLSPKIHNRAYELLGIAGEYSSFEVKADGLGEFLSSHRPNQWRGFSLTMPLKEVGILQAAEIDETVKRSGSTNTLISDGNSWKARNTDVYGFRELLSRTDFNSVSILGAGGTARSALVALDSFGGSIRVFRRDSRRDESLLKANSKIEIIDWHEVSAAFESSLVINASPIEAASDYLPKSRPTNFVIDALYSPWPPPLRTIQTDKNYISGKELLVAQAIEQIALMTDTEFDRHWLSSELLESIHPQE